LRASADTDTAPYEAALQCCSADANQQFAMASRVFYVTDLHRFEGIEVFLRPGHRH
jgi:hypothetical protein